MKKYTTIILLALVLLFFTFAYHIGNDKKTLINGASFVAPRQEISSNEFRKVNIINANWVAIIPYAFAREGNTEVTFNHHGHWWGEKKEGVVATIQMAKKENLKVMLKPHIWIRNQGWAGDFDLNTEDEWREWENNYSNYILTYAKIADSLDVDLFCIGTEYRHAATKRPDFWKGLIAQIRSFYKGKLTYAANWDNYQNISFWKDLDYIGIDAYFPLSDEKTPSVQSLVMGWEKEKRAIKTISDINKKPILFTEFGYQSVEFTASGHWNYDQDTLAVDLLGQSNAYEATFESVWKEDWFAGGFLWKWHSEHEFVGGPRCKEFTPQNKPVQSLIGAYYKNMN